MWRVKTDSLIEEGYKQAFAPGYDQADGFEDPDQVARDNEAMTYTSYTDCRRRVRGLRATRRRSTPGCGPPPCR